MPPALPYQQLVHWHMRLNVFPLRSQGMGRPHELNQTRRPFSCLGTDLDTPENWSEAVKRLKPRLLQRCLTKLGMDQALIFCRTNHDCDNLEKFLRDLGGACVRLFPGQGWGARGARILVPCMPKGDDARNQQH